LNHALSGIAEILDFGYPQNTDPGVLKTFITQQGVRTAVCLFHPSQIVPIFTLYLLTGSGAGGKCECR
jgi:hypothetical protein